MHRVPRFALDQGPGDELKEDVDCTFSSMTGDRFRSDKALLMRRPRSASTILAPPSRYSHTRPCRGAGA